MLHWYQDLLFGLHVTLIGIDDHMIRPCRKPDIIPAVISCICFHLLAGPCGKRIMPSLFHAQTQGFSQSSSTCIKAHFSLLYSVLFLHLPSSAESITSRNIIRNDPQRLIKLTHNILSFRFYLSVLYFCNLSVVSTVLKVHFPLGYFDWNVAVSDGQFDFG